MIHLYSPDRLRSLRQRALLSQREVERLTGISDATISASATAASVSSLGTISDIIPPSTSAEPQPHRRRFAIVC